MASINYDDIFELFLGQITDYEIAGMNMSEAYEVMTGYLHGVVRQAYVRRLFSTCQLDDEIQSLTYVMKLPTTEGSDSDENASIDEDFVKGMLADGMVLEWVTPIVNRTTNLNQMFAGKEQKFYSQSTQLDELQSLRENVYLKFRREIRDRGVISNGYLYDN